MDGKAVGAAGSGKPGGWISFDVTQDERHLRLVGHHPELGLVFELWCYEGGPFRKGTWEKRSDGSVVFTYKSSEMMCTTSFSPATKGRIPMDIVVEGPLAELKTIHYIAACMQFWHAPAFMREEDLVDFAERCFIYTMRGPVGLFQCARGKQKGFPPDGPENTPPCTQWHVPIDMLHPGDVWSFGASGDRTLYGLVGVTSRDGRWLSAISCRYNRNIGQGWHDCIHTVPEMQCYLDRETNRIVHRGMVYLMPNDKRKLLEAYREDLLADEGPELPLSPGEDDTLMVEPRAFAAPKLELKVDALWSPDQPMPTRAGPWEPTYWGTFVRAGERERVWAHPTAETIELCVSLAEADPEVARAKAELSGEGWIRGRAPEGVSAQVLHSSDGVWTAALFWERSEPGAPALRTPALGILTPSEEGSDTVSVRGRLLLYQGNPTDLVTRWAWASRDWQNARPYRMPVTEVSEGQ